MGPSIQAPKGVSLLRRARPSSPVASDFEAINTPASSLNSNDRKNQPHRTTYNTGMQSSEGVNCPLNILGFLVKRIFL